jgi:glyceraldehyde 3-phosphate dehydrogenase
MARIAINGLGRIERAFLKLALKRPELEAVAVNDLADPETLMYLIRFDSTYGRYDQPVTFEKGAEPVLRIGNRRTRIAASRTAA